MAYTTLQEYIDATNRTGLDGIIVYVADTFPIFIPLMLASLFVIVALSTYFSRQRLAGEGDLWSSLAVAGWLITVVAFIMTLVEGLINTFTVVICLVVSVICTMMLLVSKDKSL